MLIPLISLIIGFTKGNIRDFNRVKTSLGKTGDLSDDSIAEVLRVLILENIDRTQKQADKEHQDYKKILGDYTDMEPNNMFPDMVRDLLSNFDKELKSLI